MSVTNVSSLNRSVETTQKWLKDLAEHGHLENESQAYLLPEEPRTVWPEAA